MKIRKFLLFLLLFSAFVSAQHIDYSKPAGFENAVSDKDYKFIVNQSVEEINKYAEVAAVNQGEIQLVSIKDADQTVFYLDNVIKKCLSEERKHWDTVIEDHFKSYFDGLKFHETLDVHNFEAIRDYLSIRIYEESFVKEYSENNWITKNDLEGTTSVLMLDLPTTFTTVTKDVFNLWKKSKTEIFGIAQENVNKNEFFKHTETFETENDTIEIHFIQNEAIGSSAVLDLVKNAPEFIGEFGSVLAVPNKGFVLLSRISPEKPHDFMTFIQVNYDMVTDFYESHPQPVSKDFFWYYKGKFRKIDFQSEGNEIKITLPKELSELVLD